jgi:hypothetical protein
LPIAQFRWEVLQVSRVSDRNNRDRRKLAGDGKQFLDFLRVESCHGMYDETVGGGRQKKILGCQANIMEGVTIGLSGAFGAELCGRQDQNRRMRSPALIRFDQGFDEFTEGQGLYVSAGLRIAKVVR